VLKVIEQTSKYFYWRVFAVIHVTLKTAQKDFETIINSIINNGDSISISTDDGAAVMVSQDEWNGLIETLYLNSIPGLASTIVEGRETPISECLDSVGWDIN
jgi:PHD/YefM family antitoxin component YafN of YafNO toxin-antitoxin module